MNLDAVADRLRRATRITALTGTGVSAASGIPTFRGEDGLEINPDETDASHAVDLSIRGKAEDVLAELERLRESFS